MVTLHRIRVLLLQARHGNDPAKREEVEFFASRCGICADQFRPHDLLQGVPSLEAARRYDAVMVGGAGEFYVSRRDLSAHDEIVDFLGTLSQSGIPTFASCFGFQFLVEALGGQIVFDGENVEVGTFEMTLTQAGRDDPLFRDLPDAFLAQLGRKDRAADHVQGALTLASSQRAPVQAIRVPGQPVWASQFHPELDCEANLGRYYRYLDGYAAAMTEDERQAALASFRDSPHTADLLERFLRLVLG
jgi:GMP synthase (glutamine-hydrolysing)